MTEEEKVLKGEDALALARQGKDVWNEWAIDHLGWEVDFSKVDFNTDDNKDISFVSFIFPAGANFFGAEFCKDTEFTDATFSGFANFPGATFRGDVLFLQVTFSGLALFRKATFSGQAKFSGATFNGVNFIRATFVGEASFTSSVFNSGLLLDETTFAKVPDFQSMKTDHHVSMDSIEVAFNGKGLLKFWEQAMNNTDAAKYRRLKEMAVLAQDHEQEQNFFALEQKAMREVRYKGAALIPGLFYETLSDFGRSLKKPIVGVFALWLVFACFHFSVGYMSYFDAPSLGRLSLASLLYSGTQILPFVGSAGGARSWAAQELFYDGVPGCVHALNVVEGLCAFVFLFLIGLALRNRFRI